MFPLSSFLLTLAVTPSILASTMAPRRRHHANLALQQEVRRSFDEIRFTYYETQTGNQGACGTWLSDSDYTVALSSDEFDMSLCGTSITITYGGKTTTATIEDECPSCPSYGLDMSPDLFSFFADQSIGVLYGSWSYSSDNSATTSAAATTSWAAATTSSPDTWVAPTTTSTSDNWTPGTTSSDDNWVAATTSSTSDTWVAATTSSSDTWVSPTTTSSAWVAPTTTVSPWPAPATTSWAAVVTASAAPAPSWAPTTTSSTWDTEPTVHLDCNCTIGNDAIALYNGTELIYWGQPNGTLLYDQTALLNATTAYCLNGTEYDIDWTLGTNLTLDYYLASAFNNYTTSTGFNVSSYNISMYNATFSSGYGANATFLPSNTTADYLALIMLVGSNETSLTSSEDDIVYCDEE